MECAATAWDPYTARNIQQLEAVHSDYKTTSSTSQMISSLGWEWLQQKNWRQQVMMFHITHSLVDISAAQFIHPTTVTSIKVKTYATCYHPVELMCSATHSQQSML